MTALTESTDNLYKLYTNSIFDLAQSIRIKFDQIAENLNLQVLLDTGVQVSSSDKSTWKYYQNMSGMYHYTDTLMQVYSIDTEQTIDFTVSNLQNNPLTAEAYKFNSPLYSELLAKYPEQEALILGVLYPVDIQTAINSPDGTILAYPGHLIEDTETELIPKIQSWIYSYLSRWVNNQYSITHSLYPAVVLAQLVLHLVPLITNLRLQACKTNQAHSFHIRQYLRSHGFLDDYINEFNRKQMLDMYRNICYYERNAGFESTFNKLIDVLFTDAGFPVYEHKLFHNVEALRHEYDNDTERLYANALFRRNPINSLGHVSRLPDLDLTQEFEVLATMAPMNEEYHAIHGDEIKQSISLSKSAEMHTKVVECSLNPTYKTDLILPDQILENHWIALAGDNVLHVPVEYTPIYSTDPIRLTHQQAVAVWIYALHKVADPDVPQNSFVPLTRVPKLSVQRVTKYTIPSKSTLSTMVDYHVSSDDLDTILSTAVQVPNVVPTLKNFTNLCSQIYIAQMKQYRYYSFKEHPAARAQLQAVSNALYIDRTITLDSLVDPQDNTQSLLYSDLFTSLALNLSTYSKEDYLKMANDIYASATGSGQNSLLDPNNVRSAMVKVFQYLSSYSIEMIETFGQAELHFFAPRPDVRVYDVNSQSKSSKNVPIGILPVVSLINDPLLTVKLSLAKQITKKRFVGTSSKQITVNLTSKDNVLSRTKSTNAFVRCGSQAWGIDPSAQFNALTTNQRLALVDLYRNT